MGNDQGKLTKLQAYTPQNFGDVNLSFFTQEEVSTWFSGFIAANKPKEVLSKDKFVAEYKKYFPTGNAETFATNAFTLLDLDKVGEISIRELVASIVLSAKGSMEQRLYWAFNLFDDSDSKSLDEAGATGIARTIMKLDPKATTAQSSDDLKTKAKAWYDSIEKIDGLGVVLSDFLEAAKKDTTLSAILNSEVVAVTTAVKENTVVKHVNTQGNVKLSDTGSVSLVDLGPDFVARRVNEKENLKSLNNRFASYIKKVRHLEVQNKTLEAKLQQFTTVKPANLEALYKAELERLRGEVNTISTIKDAAVIQRDTFKVDAANWKVKYENELEKCKEFEASIETLRTEVDASTLLRVDLQRRLETSVKEIEFIRSTYAEEVRVLKEQLASRQNIRIVQAPTQNPPILAELARMREYYERLAAKNRAEMAALTKVEVEKVEIKHANNSVDLTSLKETIAALKISEGKLLAQIALMKEENASLKKQLSDNEKAHADAIASYEKRLTEATAKFNALKQSMAAQLRKYQELMSIKIALDLEIATYRKLLESEEHRIEEVNYQDEFAPSYSFNIYKDSEQQVENVQAVDVANKSQAKKPADPPT